MKLSIIVYKRLSEHKVELLIGKYNSDDEDEE